jgi:predicted protein tyrosine phosphatase
MCWNNDHLLCDTKLQILLAAGTISVHFHECTHIAHITLYYQDIYYMDQVKIVEWRLPTWVIIQFGQHWPSKTTLTSIVYCDLSMYNKMISVVIVVLQKY